MADLVAVLSNKVDAYLVCCLNCKWHDYLDSKTMPEDTLICRKLPPVFVEGRKKSFWPIVAESDFCGGFDLEHSNDYTIEVDLPVSHETNKDAS